MNLADQHRKNRADLVATRTTEAGKLATLKVERAAIDGERKAVEADLGPVRYLATLLGSTDEQTIRYFILIVALLLDPAAVLLLLAADASTLRQPRNLIESNAFRKRVPNTPCRENACQA